MATPQTTISTEAMDQLLAIRDSGATNMFARDVVQGLADGLAFDALSTWIDDHRTDYGSLIMGGIEIEKQ